MFNEMGNGSPKITTLPRLWFFLLLLLNSCGMGQPSASAAEETLRSRIDKGSEARLKIKEFRKTDGKNIEALGVKGYELMFDAQAEFVSDAMFSAGMPLISEGNEITTGEFRPEPQRFSWEEFRLGSQGFHRAKKGDHLLLTGSVTFERRESGWVAVSIHFTFKQNANKS